MITLGPVRVHVLRESTFWLDGGAMFGVVPRAVWEKTDPPDERNRVELAANCVLVETAGQRVLVETGMGDRWEARERERFRLEGEGLPAALRALDVAPEQIDVVVNTHLHFDHAGGNTRRVDGALRPTFPRARYVVQLGEWEDATHPHERSHASYREEDFVPLAEARQLETVQGEVEVAPGVRVVPVGGHTAYHQMVVVEGGGRTLAIPTDLLPTASHLRLPFLMSYDLFPVGTLEAK
ncbi:MAG TPA: MBL fold metallo-hydrolase, partial [Vicinamibacteria bacterium]|nr:MBL fold metallo-hydrolase [Vicinamibacteria bacterium]